MSYPEHVPYFGEQGVSGGRLLPQSALPAIPASIVSMQQMASAAASLPPATQQQLHAMMAGQKSQMPMGVPARVPFPAGAGGTSPYLSSIPAPPTASSSPSPFLPPATPALPSATMPGAPGPAAVSQPSNNKVKKAWTEAERGALRDSVIKYRTKKNQHKLPWKLILNDPLYSSYRQDRSKDAIMQQWKTLKKEVMDIPIPEGESDTDNGTDSESEGSNAGSSQVPALPALPKPASQRSKWTADDTQALSEAITQYGTDWRLILKDPVYAKRLKYRNAVSLGKNYHRFHPAGIETKRMAEEAKRAKKEARDEKAALDELSSTSKDESDEEDKPERRTQPVSGTSAVHHAPGSSGGGKAVKHKRAESDSDSESSGTSSNESTDDDSSPPTSPQLSRTSGVDAPIQPWEKPDERGIAHFRRCRHVCGCKSLTADGREFVNNQAVMVRGSRRNHEVNQNLHPNCRQAAKACERLLGPLKEKKKGLGGLGDDEGGGPGKEEGMDMDGDEDGGDVDELGKESSRKKKRKRDPNGTALNGQHGKQQGNGGDDAHDAFINPFVLPTSLVDAHISSLLAQLESMAHTVRQVQSAQQPTAQVVELKVENARLVKEVAGLKREVARLSGVEQDEAGEPHSELSIEQQIEHDDKQLQQQADAGHYHSDQADDSASDMQPGAAVHIALEPQLYEPHASSGHAGNANNSLARIKHELGQHSMSMPMETQQAH